MTGVKKILFGTAMFGLGAVTGYFVSKKMLDESY